MIIKRLLVYAGIILFSLGGMTGSMHHHEDGEVHEDCTVCIFVVLSKTAQASASELLALPTIYVPIQHFFKWNAPFAIVWSSYLPRGPPV